jgi:hypothetical protein
MEELGRPRSRSRERAQERRRRKRRRLARWTGGLLVLGLVFFAGLSVGRALDDDQGNRGQTFVRTLVPTTVTPQQTVTVTLSNP